MVAKAVKFERPPSIPPEALAFMDITSDEVKTVVYVYEKTIEGTKAYYKWKEGG